MKEKVLSLSASASSRWLNCTASPSLILRNQDRIKPEDTSSSYAEEGTLAHDLAAEALLLGYDESEFEDKEMAKHVKDYIDYIESMREKGDTMMVETKVQPWYLVKEKGYDGKEIDHVTHSFSDCTIYGKDRLVVIDFKYGAGISVSAEENTQMTTYAMSVAFKLMQQKKIKFSNKAKVTLAIFQPRVRGENAVREWNITMGELRDFASWIYDTAKNILRGEKTEFAPSSKTCRFCPAKAFCKAHAAHELSEEVFEDIQENLKLNLPSPDTLTDESLVKLYKHQSSITAFLKDVEKHLFGLVNSGKSDLGLKMIQGYGNRIFTDKDSAESILLDYFEEDQIFESKLVSPAKAENLFKKAKADVPKSIQDLIEKPKRGPSMVWKDHPAEELKIDAKNEFEDLSD